MFPEVDALGGLRGRFLLDCDPAIPEEAAGMGLISILPMTLCGRSREESDMGGIGREDDDDAMAMFVRGIFDGGWPVAPPPTPFMPV